MQNTAQSRDLTAADLSSHMSVVNSEGGVRKGFFYTPVRIRSRNPETHGKIEHRLCIAKQPLGDRLTVSHSYITPEQAAAQHPQEWALFTQFEDVPDYGTPLSELPGVSRSQIALLEVHGLRCIEDLTSISDDQAGQLGMDVSRAVKIARKWIANKEESSDVILAAETETKAEAALKSMEERLKKLEEHNMRLSTENDVLRRSGGASPGGRSAANPVAVASQDSLPAELPENDDFMGGGDVVTGGDDLGDNDADPLAD
jgi:hypothetical protein